VKLRAPSQADLPAVFAVLEARDRADLGVPDFTLEDLRDRWGAEEFSLAHDARVVEGETGEICGYGEVTTPGARCVVAPGHEGMGIGRRLDAWAEEREREQGRPLHRRIIASTDQAGRRRLLGAGYSFARSYIRMRRSLEPRAPAPEAGSPLGPPSPGSGVHLRELDPDRDGPGVHALDDAAFKAAPDYNAESYVAFRDEHLGAHDFDPALSRVAWSGDRIVGILLTRRWAEESAGFVDILAVHPDMQGRGIGAAMLGEAFAAYAEAGLSEACLGVSSQNPGARRLYERLGMSPHFRHDIYERPVDTGATSS
jgi:mycothiol synthase